MQVTKSGQKRINFQVDDYDKQGRMYLPADLRREVFLNEFPQF